MHRDRPTLDDVRVAAANLQGVTNVTPCRTAHRLSEKLGMPITMKMETENFTGSFKERGAYTKLSNLSAGERARGVIAASAGNHAQGVAYHARRMGIDATIVMPRTTPHTKVRRTGDFGARVILEGDSYADAALHAQALAAARALTAIHPYDDVHVMAGGGTVALEMLEQAPHVDTLVVPIGGGGLIAGMAVAAKAIRPGVRVVGVRIDEVPRGGSTVADGIAVKHVGVRNRAVIDDLVDDVVTVDEDSIERAMHVYLEAEKVVTEGAGAASLAALLRFPERFSGRNVGVVVSGGNVDTGLLASVITRVRLHEGRIVRMRAHIVDVPGALARVASTIAAQGANILDVAHQRSFNDVPAKCAELDLTIEVRWPDDVQAIVSSLNEAGFESHILDWRREDAAC